MGMALLLNTELRVLGSAGFVAGPCRFLFRI